MADKSPGRYDPRNTLNDLTGRDWLTSTRTWFTTEAADAELPPELAEVLRRYAAALVEAEPEAVAEMSPAERVELAQSWFIADSRRYWKNKDTELHPARFPEEMVERFVRFFSKAGEWVLDPFCGSGATLVTCRETARHGVGIELNPRYAKVIESRLGAGETAAVVIGADARRVAEPAIWAPALAAGCPTSGALPQFDHMITSPPYFNMLRTSRGNVVSAQKERERNGLETWYSEADHDLGNLSDYKTFLAALGGIFDGLYPLLRPGRYLVVVVQNLREPGGEVRTLAWDLARRIGQTFQFQGEQIWCQNTKKLGIWGYPRIFVPNYHHHYCLIFRRPPPPKPQSSGSSTS